MEQSEFGLEYGNETRPIPFARRNYEFVGDVFDEKERRHSVYWNNKTLRRNCFSNSCHISDVGIDDEYLKIWGKNQKVSRLQIVAV